MAKKKYIYAMVLGRMMLCEVMPPPKEPRAKARRLTDDDIDMADRALRRSAVHLYDL